MRTHGRRDVGSRESSAVPVRIPPIVLRPDFQSLMCKEPFTATQPRGVNTEIRAAEQLTAARRSSLHHPCPMPAQRCLNLWSLPYEVLQLPKAERLAVIKKLQKVSGEHGFAPGELSGDAPITAIEELMALAFLSVVMGGPLLLLACGLGCLIFGSWTHCALWALAALVLAFHPLPDIAEPMSRSRLTLALYKYFSYRWLWDGDSDEAGQAAAPFIGFGPPHGVMPFANVLSIPAINT